MMSLYDSDLNSEKEIQRFDSDKEPPKENKNDRKVIKKTKNLKIYKYILQVGDGIQRPAKYDEIQFRIMQTDEKEGKSTYERLLQEPIKVVNLGRNNMDVWFDDALENLRKNEIATIQVKRIQEDNKDNLKKYQKSEFYMIHLVDWITIVDLDQDGNFMKKIFQKGQGQDRVSLGDEISFDYKIIQANEILEEKSFINEIIRDNTNNTSTNNPVLLKLLKTMKKGEHAECTVTLDKYIQECTSTNPELEARLKAKAEDVVVNVHVKELVKIDDIFEDGLVTKRILSKGNSTAKAENSSEVFLNFRIINQANGEEVFSTMNTSANANTSVNIDNVFSKEGLFTKDQIKDFEFLRTSDQCFKAYLDEYKVSRMLKNVLKRVKKMEHSIVIVKGDKYIKYGADYNILKEKNILNPFIELKYEIFMYNFTEDKNGFTMNVKEKMFHAERKKKIGLELFKKGQYKKALKTFEVVNSYFDLGTFNPEEEEIIKPMKIAVLANTSLCLQKLNHWKEIRIVCDRILKIDPQNTKAVYRKATALKHLQEYKEAIELLTVYKEVVGDNLDLDTKKEFACLLSAIKSEEMKYTKKEKSIYASMFGVK